MDNGVTEFRKRDVLCRAKIVRSRTMIGTKLMTEKKVMRWWCLGRRAIAGDVGWSQRGGVDGVGGRNDCKGEDSVIGREAAVGTVVAVD
ncbi:Hypothetical predicted protein [Olea europaea subsp. europaea]|uniref:Uncharacterized protein n=1 Tax=Olea europaea subsp. europaea TaxID=158383 RepID=A0A8S0TRE6_OLEEU|nr:Hypothetical predicted protein [Olea europaea subsp. europaea]